MDKKILPAVISALVLISTGISCLAAPWRSDSRQAATSKTDTAHSSAPATVKLMEMTGRVIDISDTKIVVDTYETTGLHKHETYIIDARLKLENALSINEITYGDRILVKYTSESGKNIAKVINTQPPAAQSER